MCHFTENESVAPISVKAKEVQMLFGILRNLFEFKSSSLKYGRIDKYTNNAMVMQVIYTILKGYH